MTRLLLIRHAHVDTGPGAGRLCGWLDLPLSAAGEQQLVELRDRGLARERPAALYTSTLRRAREVATALGDLWDLSPHPLDTVREIHCGELEGRSIDELRASSLTWCRATKLRTMTISPGRAAKVIASCANVWSRRFRRSRRDIRRRVSPSLRTPA